MTSVEEVEYSVMDDEMSLIVSDSDDDQTLSEGEYEEEQEEIKPNASLENTGCDSVVEKLAVTVNGSGVGSKREPKLSSAVHSSSKKPCMPQRRRSERDRHADQVTRDRHYHQLGSRPRTENHHDEHRWSGMNPRKRQGFGAIGTRCPRYEPQHENWHDRHNHDDGPSHRRRYSERRPHCTDERRRKFGHRFDEVRDPRRIHHRSPLLRENTQQEDLRAMLDRNSYRKHDHGNRHDYAECYVNISKPVTADRINEIFEQCRIELSKGPPNGGFRADTSNAWCAALSYGTTHYSPEGRRTTWDALMEHGAELHRMFEVRPQASETARALRDAVLRNESLIESLASADEMITWMKVLMTKKLPIRPSDPIIATAGAILATLRQKISPVMQCYLPSVGKRSLDEICCRLEPADMTCLPLFMLITLGLVARAVETGTSSISYFDVDPRRLIMAGYKPGACLAGFLEFLDDHRKKCENASCRLYSSYIIVPIYIHGKYYYCNEMF
ncbi:multifunctional expression regulator [Spheniscid alphaherpesvirus 1]|uniref:Multifunctional expression regulator n=1 Tax=Spheniscid alphaherpesvirus 1 TaxID=2560777 RepID=A0A1R3TF66_9ALPH|nr:multifunctional expression regulator [Spheniscid alphaherpesvirus 1]